jgi:outer membrane receptor protein involved in Fe transport
MDLEIEMSSTPPRHRPDWRGGLGLRWTPSDKWLVDASWLNVGKTFDSSVPTGDMFLDSYSRVDVAATFRHSQKLNILLSADNLFDASYAEAIGFPAVGTRARIGFRYRF